ncbi:hypothetical protein D3C87_2123510 [compost metagenome]
MANTPSVKIAGLLRHIVGPNCIIGIFASRKSCAYSQILIKSSDLGRNRTTDNNCIGGSERNYSLQARGT